MEFRESGVMMSPACLENFLSLSFLQDKLELDTLMPGASEAISHPTGSRILTLLAISLHP